MKESIKEKIEKRFPNIKFKKIIVYKNPNEFTSMYIERVNPNHVGILWGRRNKKFNKGSHYVKAGMVYFASLYALVGAVVLGWLDVATNFFYIWLINIGILGILTGFMVSIAYYMVVLWLPNTKSYREYLKDV